MCIKVPLGTWVLVGLAVWVSLLKSRYSSEWRAEWIVLAHLVTSLVFVSANTGFSHHMRYVLPIFPFAFVWASKVFRAYEMREVTVFSIACASLGWSVLSSAAIVPHSLSYFNELVGPTNGSWHLNGSNVDWGQDVYLVRDWLDAHPEATDVCVTCDVLYSTATLGVPGRLPPADGPRPGWYVISVNQINGRVGEHAYFKLLEPKDRIGYSMNVYHVTKKDANRVRRELGLAELP